MFLQLLKLYNCDNYEGNLEKYDLWVGRPNVSPMWYVVIWFLCSMRNRWKSVQQALLRLLPTEFVYSHSPGPRLEEGKMYFKVLTLFPATCKLRSTQALARPLTMICERCSVVVCEAQGHDSEVLH